jgi:putative ABC transport system substrate-binding protein
MKRRAFLVLIGGAIAASTPAARAEQDAAIRRVGVLMPFSPEDPKVKTDLAAFARQLQSLGWTQGQNLQIDYRWSTGDTAKMQADAKELVATRPDVLFTRSTPATAALLSNTQSVPVVFAVVSDPVGEGFVASVARPGGNATGFTNAESSLTGKWVGLLKEIKPSLARVGYIFDPKLAPGGGIYYAGLVKSEATLSGLTSTPLPLHEPSQIQSMIDEFAQAPNGGLVVLPDAGTNLHRAQIIAAATRAGMPAIYGFRNLAEEGGLMSYGVDVTELFRRAADYVDRILKGAKPGDLPVQLPDKFEFVINLKRKDPQYSDSAWRPRHRRCGDRIKARSRIRAATVTRSRTATSATTN